MTQRLLSDVGSSEAAVETVPAPRTREGKGPTDRGDWRLLNDPIDFLTEKKFGFDGRVEKTLGRQFVNTLSDVPVSMNCECRGCWHGYYALQGPGNCAWRALHVFLGGLCLFFRARARVRSFLTFPLTLNNDINQNSLTLTFASQFVCSKVP